MAPKKKYPIMKQCIICLLDFEVKSPNHNHNKTCSRACANKLIGNKRGLLYECDMEQLLQDYNNNLSYTELKAKHFLSDVALYNRLKFLIQSGKLIKRPQLQYVHSKKEINLDLLKKAYAGCTRKELMRIFDCGRGVINDRILKLQKDGLLPLKSKSFQYNVEDLKQAYLFFEGSAFEVANKFKVSKSTITKHLKRLHVNGLLPEYGSFREIGRQKIKDTWKPHWI
jgi:transposase